jgi:hypothetical protein
MVACVGRCGSALDLVRRRWLSGGDCRCILFSKIVKCNLKKHTLGLRRVASRAPAAVMVSSGDVAGGGGGESGGGAICRTWFCCAVVVD